MPPPFHRTPLPLRPPPVPATTPHTARRITSHDLFGPHREMVIAHDGREYRLRITQNNRLILTA